MKYIMLLTVGAALIACQPKHPDAVLLQQVSGQVIAPSYQLLADRAANVYNTAKACSQQSVPASTVLAKLKGEWRATMAAWQGVQWVRFGPIMAQSREWQLQFWPDSKNIIGRKMLNLLRQEPIEQGHIERAGIVVQGLSGLEYILFDPKAATVAGPAKRCQATLLIARQLALTTEALHREWPQFYQQQRALAAKMAGDSQHPATLLVLNSLVQQSDFILNKKLATPLDIDGARGRVNPYFLESWRSQTSFDHLRENIQALDRLFYQGGLQSYLVAKGAQALAGDMARQLDTLNQHLQGTHSHFNFSAVSKEGETIKQRVKPLYQAFYHLHHLIKIDLVKTLQVSLSFNASDGDS